jgi:hypothetical protein
MAKHFPWRLSRADTHLTDEQIFAHLEGTPPAPLPAHMAQHLTSCWKCLARKQQLQDTIFRVVEYQQQVLAPFLPPPPHAEERLIASLDQQRPPSRATREPWPSKIMSLLSLPGNWRIPVVAGALVALFAAGTLLTVQHRASSQVSVIELLQSATVSETSKLTTGSGVAVQRIRIHTPRQTLERTLYFDVQRRRHPKVERVSGEEERLSRTLAQAGVNWENPLSAASFKDWHDHETVQKDQVAQTSDGLLTLTTSVASGAVAAESLTVRKNDFHPVARTIQFRDEGIAEIAELDYTVLGWNAQNEAIFDPASPGPATALSAPPLPTLPLLPTREDLDEAELQARLALSHIGADSSEPLEFSRSNRAIEISGVVATEERKNQLLAQLRPLPHITASIFSIGELSARRSVPGAEAGAVQAYSTVAGPSPLSIFFGQRARSQSDTSLVSQQLLDSALAVQQEGSALTELSQRFSSDARLSEPAQKALRTLLTAHLDKLDNALHAEEEVVGSLQALEGSPPGSTVPSAIARSQTLTFAAARNRALCSELISGSESSPRSAQAIIPEILGSMEDVRRTAKNARTSVVSGPVREPSPER